MVLYLLFAQHSLTPTKHIRSCLKGHKSLFCVFQKWHGDKVIELWGRPAKILSLNDQILTLLPEHCCYDMKVIATSDISEAFVLERLVNLNLRLFDKISKLFFLRRLRQREKLKDLLKPLHFLPCFPFCHCQLRTNCFPGKKVANATDQGLLNEMVESFWKSKSLKGLTALVGCNIYCQLWTSTGAMYRYHPIVGPMVGSHWKT